MSLKQLIFMNQKVALSRGLANVTIHNGISGSILRRRSPKPQFIQEKTSE